MKNKLLISETINQNNFDILRVLLATLVILCHCYVIYHGYEVFKQREPFMKWSGQQISMGTTAVNFFFVISGFLILKSLERSSSFWEYLKKRILRIYPGFLVVVLLSFLVFGPIGHMQTFSLSAYMDFLDFVPLKREVARMFSLQSPLETRYFQELPQSGLNNSLWTIQYEFICYLLLPLLALLGMVKNRSLLVVALLLCYSVLCFQSFGYIFPFEPELNGKVIGNPYFYPSFFTYFLCGACCYLYRETLVRSKWLALLSFGLIIIAFRVNLIAQTLPLAGTYLLFYLAYHPRLQYPAFSKHGDLSYGIYLYGWPIQQLIMLFFGAYLSPIIFFLLVMPLVSIFAFLSWRFVESPALRLKKQRTSRKLEQLPV